LLQAEVAAEVEEVLLQDSFLENQMMERYIQEMGNMSSQQEEVEEEVVEEEVAVEVEEEVLKNYTSIVLH
jgi:uncharacterized protein YllA (UPF0747 family)